MELVGIAVAVAALAGSAAIAYLVDRSPARAGRRTALLAVGFAFAVFLAFAVFGLAQVNYTWPIIWIVAVVVSAAVALALFVRIATDVRWRPLKLLGLLSAALVAIVAFGSLGMSGVGSGQLQPLYEKRAAQIAKANGFTALLVSGEKMPTDSLPVDALPAPDAGLGISYDGFQLQERRSAGPMTVEDLQKLVAAGTSPVVGAPAIPAGAASTNYTVQGRPAVGVKYDSAPKGGEPAKGSKTFTTVVLVTELNGVEVRIISDSGVVEGGGDISVPFSNASLEDLAQIAEALRPVE